MGFYAKYLKYSQLNETIKIIVENRVHLRFIVAQQIPSDSVKR